MDMKSKESFNEKLDLLIIDIDNTFIYHRTVAAANKLLLKTINKDLKFPKTKDSIKNTIRFLLPNKKQRKLIITGIKLYAFYFIRELVNKYYNRISSEWMIKEWAETIPKLNIKGEDYVLAEKTIKNNLNRDMVNIYKKIKAKKVISLSEHFSIGKDPIENILNCKNISNEFTLRKNKIVGYRLNIKNGKDKLRIAKKYVKSLKAKKIGIIIEDYDDLNLLELKPIIIVAHARLKRYIKKHIRYENNIIYFN